MNSCSGGKFWRKSIRRKKIGGKMGPSPLVSSSSAQRLLSCRSFDNGFQIFFGGEKLPGGKNSGERGGRADENTKNTTTDQVIILKFYIVCNMYNTCKRLSHLTSLLWHIHAKNPSNYYDSAHPRWWHWMELHWNSGEDNPCRFFDQKKSRSIFWSRSVHTPGPKFDRFILLLV